MKWLDIETAPKDGSCVLVYPPLWSSRTCSIARYDDDRYAKKPKPYWARDDANGRISQCRNAPPTRWQPLPEPPGVE